MLDRPLALALLRAFHPPRPPIDPKRQRDVYVSLGWQPGEEVLNRAICADARAEGFRLIGDDRNRHAYGPDRIREIMQTCGGFLAIIPGRQGDTAWAEDDAERGKSDYRYFLREADCAASLGLPSLVVAPEGLRRIDGDDGGWLRVPAGTARATDAVKQALATLYREWRTPENEDLIFFATDLRRDALLESGELKAMIEAISGMRVVVGTDLQGGTIQDRIMATIAGAHLVVADLSGDTEDGFSLNVGIEAGIAKSHGRHLRMMARGPMRRPPFMLQSAGQLDAYRDDVERIALIRRLAADFRRMIYD